jgi:tetratricopeptide (TPR) repeat protein
MGDSEFALQLVKDVVPEDVAQSLSSPRQTKKMGMLAPEEGLAAFYVRLAEALIEQGAPEKGLIFARMANWLVPTNDAAKLVLARALDLDGSQATARAVRAEIRQQSHYWTRASISEIVQLSADKKHEEALRLAERLVAQRDSKELRQLLGQTQEAAGQLEQARQTFAGLVNSGEASRAAPQRLATYYFSLGTITHKQGQWRAARALLEKGLILDPQNAYISNYLGYSMLERGEDLGKAVEMLRRAYRLAPESAAIADSLGWGLYLTGDYQNAVYYLEKSAKVSGNDLVINEHLGDAYWRAGRKIEARYAWRIAELLAEGEDAARLTNKINIGLDS